MQVVVADATPLHYLILIDAVHVLPRIFEKIHVPIEIRDELTCEGTPLPVRTWMQHPPLWLEVLATPIVTSVDSSLESLDSGERAAILAQRRGLAVTGTLGVLDLASRGGMLDLRDAFVRLQRTNFRYPPSLMEMLLEEERNRKNRGV